MTDLVDLSIPLEREVQLQLEQWGMSFAASHLEITVSQLDVLDRFARIAVRTLIPKQSVANDSYMRTYEVPSSVWQMWKERHAPLWLTNRWPVQYDTEEVEVRVERCLLYPNATIHFSGLGDPVIHERVAW